MLRFYRILAPTDFSEESLQALPYAMELAWEHKASVVLAHVASNQAEVESARKRLMDLAASYQAVDVLQFIEVGASPAGLLKIAGMSGADFCIMATHGHTGLRRMLMGSTTEALMRSLGCPMLTIRPGSRGLLVPRPPLAEPAARLSTTETISARCVTDEDLFFARHDRQLILEDWKKRQPPFPFRLEVRRILVPVDLTETSFEAMDMARSLAVAFESQITVMHVVDKLPPEVGAYSESSTHRVEQLASTIGLPDTDVIVANGTPHRAILDAARRIEADLVVTATRGRQGAERLLLGSTAEQLVRHAPCPVVVLRAGMMLNRALDEVELVVRNR